MNGARNRILLGIAVAGLAAWLAVSRCRDLAEEAPAAQQSAPVRSTPVEVGDVEEILEVFGSVEFDREHTLTLTSVRSSSVVGVRIVPGERVQRGEPLVLLGPVPEASPEAQRSKIEFAFATAEVERVQRMASLRLATNQEVQAAEKQLEASRAALNALGLGPQEPGALKAPSDGVVAEVLIGEGSVVQPGQELLRIAPAGTMIIRAGFEVEEMSSLHEGLTVRVEPAFHAEGDAMVSASLARLHRVADPVTQLVEGLIRLDAPPEWAVAGSRVRLQVVLRSAPGVLRLPAAALVRHADATGTWRVVEERAEFARLELGVEGSDWVEVRSGLQAGERVVLSGRTGLADGMLVREVP